MAVIFEIFSAAVQLYRFKSQHYLIICDTVVAVKSVVGNFTVYNGKTGFAVIAAAVVGRKAVVRRFNGSVLHFVALIRFGIAVNGAVFVNLEISYHFSLGPT